MAQSVLASMGKLPRKLKRIKLLIIYLYENAHKISSPEVNSNRSAPDVRGKSLTKING